MTRRELYEKIWSAPITEVAKEIGVAYSKLKKVCEKWNIPVPTNSYWALLRYGAKVQPPELPEWSGSEQTLEEMMGTPNKKTRDRAVIATNVLTGAEMYFPSIKEVQKALQSSYVSVFRAAKQGLKHKGMLLRFAKDGETAKDSEAVKQEVVARFDKALTEVRECFMQMLYGNERVD